jgi:hypothetical protein
MEKKFIEVGRGNAKVRINIVHQTKNGKQYRSYVVNEYVYDQRTGKQERKPRWMTNLRAAKEKATEIVAALSAGKSDVLRWQDEYRAEIHKAIEVVKPTGLSILPACQLFQQAVNILGSPDELLSAAEHWKRNRPTKPLTPTPVKIAADEYQQRRRTHISCKRHSTETTYFKTFKARFGEASLHEVETSDLQDFVDAKPWKPKSRNDFLTSISAFYAAAQLRHWVPADFNPAKRVTRKKEIRGPIHIFEPWEAKQILVRLSVRDRELVPVMALALFAGIRKEEIGRMTWPQENRGLTTGHIQMEAAKTKTGHARSVPIAENLRAWLTLFRKESGTVVPSSWLTGTTKRENRLDDMTRRIARICAIVWRCNAARHSFATYHFKLHKDAGATTSALGNSLQLFQKHYWNQSHCVTEEAAR